MGVELPEANDYRVTREFAARSQIDTSIRLFSSELDHISAHVLAWAATDMLRGIAKAKGIQTLQEELEACVKPERLGDWRRNLKRAYNFSKHADRDPDAEISEFRRETTSWALFTGAINYKRIFGAQTWKMSVFQYWFYCRHPDLAVEPISSVIPQLSGCFGEEINGDLSEALTGLHELLIVSEFEFKLIKQSLGEEWEDKIVFT